MQIMEVSRRPGTPLFSTKKRKIKTGIKGRTRMRMMRRGMMILKMIMKKRMIMNMKITRKNMKVIKLYYKCFH